MAAIIHGSEHRTFDEPALLILAQLLTLRAALGWQMTLTVLTAAVLWAALQELYDYALSFRRALPRERVVAGHEAAPLGNRPGK